MPKFIPGLRLSKLYFQNVVKPIIDKEFPGLKYSAGLIGHCSEVLGFDDAISRDHNWGLRILLFLNEKDFNSLRNNINIKLSESLPYEFLGYSTNFSKPESNGIRQPIKINQGKVNHLIEFYTIKSFFKSQLDFDPYKKISALDWLTFSQQRLIEIVSGDVFHDELGLNKIRSKFNYYPKEIWLYCLAAQWKKISQEEAFLGRSGEAGDELGSQIIAAHSIKELMKLCFLMERKYYPYSKWFGRAFSNLKCSKKLEPIFRKCLLSDTWKERERWLVQAYELIAEMHNSLKFTKLLNVKVVNYYERPYKVIRAERFYKAILSLIKDKENKNIKTMIGSVDQYIDSTDAIEDLEICKLLQDAYK